MHIEVIPDKSILIIPLKIIVLEARCFTPCIDYGAVVSSSTKG